MKKILVQKENNMEFEEDYCFPALRIKTRVLC